MTTSRSFFLSVVFFSLIVAAPATAQDSSSDPDASLEAPGLASASASEERATRSASRERDRTMEHLRFEGTIGFLGGWARYADLGLAGALPPTAFEEGPVAGAPIAGLRYDLRLVVAFVRMTAGADLAWSLYDARGATRTIALDDAALTVTDRSVFSWALRFGLGLELAATEDVRLFADLLGSVRFVEVESSVASASTPGSNVSSQVTTFAPALRVGARMRVVDAFFVQLAADGSPIGPWVTGELSVGGAFE